MDLNLDLYFDLVIDWDLELELYLDLDRVDLKWEFDLVLVQGQESMLVVSYF